MGLGLQGLASTLNDPQMLQQALKELQETLHRLTPAEQWEVKKALPFATSEWQEGLALSLKPSFAHAAVQGRQVIAWSLSGCTATLKSP